MTDCPEESLDPADWTETQETARRMVEDAFAHIGTLRDRPVWQQMPQSVRDHFETNVPLDPMPVGAVYEEFQSHVLPYAMGNTHPRFWGWYMGSGNMTGAMADFLAAIDGSNLGGGNTAAAQVDRQVVNWLKQMVEFPASASGTLTSGGSVANMVCLTVARNKMAGVDVREEGITALPKPLRFYTSDQVHSASQKALETLGLGRRALHIVPSDANLKLDIAALKKAIEDDRAAGYLPTCVIATAGTTNTGAIDDMPTIADLCERENMWFHVDGCIGALIKIAPENRSLVDGIERADSMALDPHKWLHTPFEAGCALVRDAALHFHTFELHGEYLEEKPRGVAAAEFLGDYGFELSRGFKALKIWMSIKEQGVAKFGRLIDQNIAQGSYLTQLIQENALLELVAPTSINIVCFRYCGSSLAETELKELNTEIMLRLQETGVAVPSDTTVGDRHCLRVAINNHRTKKQDLDLLVREVTRLGQDLERARHNSLASHRS